jgi:hypothetical protein
MFVFHALHVTSSEVTCTNQIIPVLLFSGLVVPSSASGSATTMNDGSLQLVGHAQRASTAVQQSLRQELLRNSSSSDLLHHEVDERVSVILG